MVDTPLLAFSLPHKGVRSCKVSRNGQYAVSTSVERDEARREDMPSDSRIRYPSSIAVWNLAERNLINFFSPKFYIVNFDFHADDTGKELLLVAIGYETDTRDPGASVRMWNCRSGCILWTALPSPLYGWAVRCRFFAEGTRVAAAFSSNFGSKFVWLQASGTIENSKGNFAYANEHLDESQARIRDFAIADNGKTLALVVEENEEGLCFVETIVAPFARSRKNPAWEVPEVIGREIPMDPVPNPVLLPQGAFLGYMAGSMFHFYEVRRERRMRGARIDVPILDSERVLHVTWVRSGSPFICVMYPEKIVLMSAESCTNYPCLQHGDTKGDSPFPIAGELRQQYSGFQGQQLMDMDSLNRFVSCANDKINIWDLRSEHVDLCLIEKEFPRPPDARGQGQARGFCQLCQISADTNEIIAGGAHTATRVCTPGAPQEESLGQNNSRVLGTSISDDGRVVASISNDGVLRVWRREGTTSLVLQYRQPRSPRTPFPTGYGCTLMQGGTRVLATFYDLNAQWNRKQCEGETVIINVQTGEVEKSWRSSDTAHYSCAASEDGSVVAFCRAIPNRLMEVVAICKDENGQEVHTSFTCDKYGWDPSLAIDKSGTTLYIADNRYLIKCDPRRPRSQQIVLHTFTLLGRVLFPYCAVSPDNDWVMVLIGVSQYYILDTKTGRRLFTLGWKGMNGRGCSLNKQYAVAGCEDGHVYIWRLAPSAVEW